MSNLAFVAAAYGLTWAVLAIYAIQINRRLKSVEASLSHLDGGDLTDAQGRATLAATGAAADEEPQRREARLT